MNVLNILLPHDIRPGDIGLVVYLHGLLFAKEDGFGDTFEAQVAALLAEFYLSFKPNRERLWVAEKNERIIGSAGPLAEDALIDLESFTYRPDNNDWLKNNNDKLILVEWPVKGSVVL